MKTNDIVKGSVSSVNTGSQNKKNVGTQGERVEKNLIPVNDKQ